MLASSSTTTASNEELILKKLLASTEEDEGGYSSVSTDEEDDNQLNGLNNQGYSYPSFSAVTRSVVPIKEVVRKISEKFAQQRRELMSNTLVKIWKSWPKRRFFENECPPKFFALRRALVFIERDESSGLPVWCVDKNFENVVEDSLMNSLPVIKLMKSWTSSD